MDRQVFSAGHTRPPVPHQASLHLFEHLLEQQLLHCGWCIGSCRLLPEPSRIKRPNKKGITASRVALPSDPAYISHIAGFDIGIG